MGALAGPADAATGPKIGASRHQLQDHGVAAMKLAFGKLGEVAMRELMSNPAVQASFSGLDRYVDREKLSEVFGRK